MAYTGVLRQESAGKIHGWACEYCGLKAETARRSAPEAWLNSGGRGIRLSSMTYIASAIFCTERCHAKWNKKPWPPVKDEAEVSF